LKNTYKGLKHVLGVAADGSYWGLKNTYKGLKLDLTTDPSGWGSRLKNTYKGLKPLTRGQMAKVVD
jgi:hypothetical protein